MRLKSVCLAIAGLVSLAAPAAAFAQPYWGDGGYRDGWRDNDWRRHEWRERHERWRGREGWGYGRGWRERCVTEMRGYWNWRGDYVYRPVRVCYR